MSCKSSKITRFVFLVTLFVEPAVWSSCRALPRTLLLGFTTRFDLFVGVGQGALCPTRMTASACYSMMKLLRYYAASQWFQVFVRR